MAEAQILVARVGKMAQVRVVGRASMNCSRGFRDFAFAALDAGVERLLVDLSACEAMDSTFMGILAQIGVRSKQKKAQFEVVNASETRKKQLKVIGVHRVVTFTQTDDLNEEWTNVSGATASELEHAKMVYKAHETLIEIDSKNIPEFKDVVDFLRDDIARREET
ncbi:MAG: anti-anti-sigma factor [Rhodothermales bacterium]|jgi:anti-anti-sigma factor